MIGSLEFSLSVSRLASRLRDLTGVAYDSLDPQAKQRIFAERRQPRAKDKPVIRG